MPMLSELYKKYHPKINFLFVYILEAHAQDEWPIRSSRACPRGSPICINQTRSVCDRSAVAQKFKEDFCLEFPIILDDPLTNSFEKLYAPWPVRIFVVDGNKKLIYKAQPGADMLELKPLRSILESLV